MWLRFRLWAGDSCRQTHLCELIGIMLVNTQSIYRQGLVIEGTSASRLTRVRAQGLCRRRDVPHHCQLHGWFLSEGNNISIKSQIPTFPSLSLLLVSESESTSSFRNPLLGWIGIQMCNFSQSGFCTSVDVLGRTHIPFYPHQDTLEGTHSDN